MPSGPNSPQSQDERPGSGHRKTLESLREYSPYLTLGFQLAAAVVVFLLVGYWLDDLWGTFPWLTLGGLVLGTTGGFVKFFRTIAELERRNMQERK